MKTSFAVDHFWKAALIGIAVVPVLAQVAPEPKSKLSTEMKLEKPSVKDWTPQIVTKAKFKNVVLADQYEFKVENNLPDDYFSKRMSVADRLAGTTGELLEKRRVVLDQESMKELLALVSKSSGRLVNEPANSDKFKAASRALERVVNESAKTGTSKADGSTYITAKDIQGALFKICPLYPIC